MINREITLSELLYLCVVRGQSSGVIERQFNLLKADILSTRFDVLEPVVVFNLNRYDTISKKVELEILKVILGESKLFVNLRELKDPYCWVLKTFFRKKFHKIWKKLKEGLPLQQEDFLLLGLPEKERKKPINYQINEF